MRPQYSRLRKCLGSPKEFPKAQIDEATDGYEAGFKTRDLKPDVVIRKRRTKTISQK